MSAPIVERLRHLQHFGNIPLDARVVVTEAADTIEALLGALEAIKRLGLQELRFTHEAAIAIQMDAAIAKARAS